MMRISDYDFVREQQAACQRWAERERLARRNARRPRRLRTRVLAVLRLRRNQEAR